MYKYRHTEVYKGVRIDKRANTTKELLEKVQRKKQEINDGGVNSNTLFGSYAYKWAEIYKKPNVSASWYADIRCRIKQIIEGVGNKPIGKITTTEVQACLNTLTAFSDSHIKKQYDIVNQIFTRAYKDGLIAKPLDIECPKGQKNATGRSLTEHEKEVLLKVLKGHRGEVFCKLMLFCGLRGGEASALLWEDVDLEKKIIHINKALKKDGTIGLPKSLSGIRDVPIPKNFALELKQKKKASPFVCVNTQGEPYTKSARVKLWQGIKRQMNIEMGCKVFRNQLLEPLPLEEPFKMHFLRHTYCTDLEKAGVPINIAKVLMGHSSISVTAGIYTHADNSTIEYARRLIDVANGVAENRATVGI